MDELKYLTNKHNVIQLTLSLQKIATAIRVGKDRSIKDGNIKEIDFLKEQCVAENVQLCLLAHQTFVQLVEDGTLEAANILSMFISMLPNANISQYTAISEGVISLLLLDLKRRSHLMKNNETYVCPFGIKPPQHPVIMLLQKKDVNMNDLVNKINGILNHHDKEIKKNSIEFLRPVFLYILCNPNVIQDSITIWTCLLSHSNKSTVAQALVYEILCWSKVSSASSCLYTSILVTEAINYQLDHKNHKAAIEFTIYLTSLLKDIISYGYDPRPGLNVIFRVLIEAEAAAVYYLDLFIVLLSNFLHSISPAYVADMTRLLKFIIVNLNGGNCITRHMIVDGLIVWIANPSLLAADALSDAKHLISFITTDWNGKPISLPMFDVKYFHPNVAISYDLAVLSSRFHSQIMDDSFEGLEQFIDNSAPQFSDIINLFLRGIFLCDKIPIRISLKILKIILKNFATNESVAIDMILPVLYKLSKETRNAEGQLELLRALTACGVIKENIPIILNTLKSLSTGSMRPLAIDLYLRLWKCESRTYPFLHKLLSYEKDKNSFELNVTKANTIREICLLKPAQHGTDLVVHLSNILNNCSGNYGDAATSIALEAIIVLCNSHTVNVASTWKALKTKFGNEKRERSVKSLCKFFGKVPLLRSPTMEYEDLYVESIDILWRYVVYSDKSAIISSALNELHHFNYSELSLKQIPDIYRQKITLPSEYAKTPIDAGRDPAEVLPYVPGECWLQLLQFVNHSAIDAAADLVAHHIHNEIDGYRGGVYILPEGKPEPKNLNQLHARSPLRSIVKYLLSQSKESIGQNELIVVNCLKCLARKFPKPIPPLDWFFLLEFMNYSLEMRTLCVAIAAHQIEQSGTARSIIENYLRELDGSCKDESEIENVFRLLPEFANSVQLNIFQQLVEFLFNYSFTVSKSMAFDQGCLFEKLIENLKNLFTIRSEAWENFDKVTTMIETYTELIDVNCRIFPEFIDLFNYLPNGTIDAISSPNTWWEMPLDKFRKATQIRCHLAVVNRIKMENSLVWLNAIVDNVTKSGIDQTYVLREIARTLRLCDIDRDACVWTMDILSKLQAILSDSQTNNEKQSLFLFDLFTLCVVVIAGCNNFHGPIEGVCDSRQTRLQLFAESLYILCEKPHWKDNIIRIYEFLYHIYVNTELPQHFKDAARNAVICSKNHSYFVQKNVWTKYAGLRQ